MATSGTNPNPAHLNPSELGTKEYWNHLYTRELSNHASDPNDIGTVWFDDSDAEAKMVQFLCTQADEPSPDLPLLSKEQASMLDLGCGNGSMLFALREEEWSGTALGVDYSPQSVALARQVAASKQEEEAEGESGEEVAFAEWDIIAGPYETVLDGAQSAGWDVVLDKGTFDAISLSDEKDVQGRRLCEAYRGRVLPLVKKGGILLVTSCNWTEEELSSWFVVPKSSDGSNETDGAFELAGRVAYPSFSFGGVKGQTISTLCFRRV